MFDLLRLDALLKAVRHKVLMIVIITTTIAITPLIFSCENKKLAARKQAADLPDTATVVAVIDGDTFVISSGKTARIALIDTPESNEPYYDSAAQFLANLILDKIVNIKPLPSQTDRYGRILAEVFIDSINVGMSILAHGLGVLYLYPEDSHLKEIYLTLQQRALREKAGIWSLAEPEPEDYYINLKGSYRFHRPLCVHLKSSNPSKIRRLGSRKEALSRGLSPCRTCKP